VVCLSPSSLRYRHAASIATPIRVHASMGLGCNVEKSKVWAASGGHAPSVQPARLFGG